MIVVSDRGRIIRVPVADVLYTEGRAQVRDACARPSTPTCSTTRSPSSSERLGEHFLRVHRNALVARRAVRALERRAIAGDHGRGRLGRLGRLHGAGRRMAGSVAAAGRGGAGGAGRDRALARRLRRATVRNVSRRRLSETIRACPRALASGWANRAGRSFRQPLVLAALLAAAAWWLSGGEDSSPIASTGANRHRSPLRFRTARPRSQASPPRKARARPKWPRRMDEIEVCGGHWLKVRCGRAAGRGRTLRRCLPGPMDEVASMALATMSSSGLAPCPGRRRNTFVPVAPMSPPPWVANCDSPDLHRRLGVSGDAMARDSARPWRRLAQTSDDAQVYAWALSRLPRRLESGTGILSGA